jgi:tRNA nucleotidyltransferase/poly(A) polymerase
MAGLIGPETIPREGRGLAYTPPVSSPRPAATEVEPPDAVRRVVETLAAAGHEAVLVGGCLRDLCLGRPVSDWDVATAAPPEAVLALFPRAVPIGLGHGTVMIPSAAGPIDVTPFRAPDLAGDLARRDFTLNAMALALAPPRWLDPQGGLADLRAGRLRAVGSARDRLAEDPLRALRAVRLAAELDLALDPELEAALAGAADGVQRVAPERVRSELERLLRSPGVGPALERLRTSGLESAITRGPIAPDAAAVVAALPPDLTLRLAAWLRGRDARAVLARLRFPRARAAAVAERVRAHPIDARGEDADLGRLLVRLGRQGVTDLLALREAELAAGSLASAVAQRAAARLAALRRALEGLERGGALSDGRPRLAIDGGDVMRWLGCPPGPQVGRALRYLTLQILDDPARNQPATLQALLRAWHEAGERP